jgi:transcriptional regulator with XRE-family HTH domain
MDLKQVFIGNLRNFRNNRGISQMKLAEMCNTATNYIGEIEIGRRFPSLKLIEKISQALEVEPYLFFLERNGEKYHELNDIVDILIKLPDQIKLNVINHISTPWDPKHSANK